MSLLTIKENSFIDNRTLGDIADPKDEATNEYKFHPSIFLFKKIKK